MSHSNAESHDLEQLYLRYSKLLYRLAYKYLYNHTGNAADAADIVQDVFVYAARKQDELQKHSNPGGWLVKVTYFYCKNYVRAYYSRMNKARFASEQLLSHQPHIYGKLYTGAAEDEFAKLDMLLAFEQSLTKEEHATMKAYCLDRIPAREICRQSGVSETAIRARISRTRRKIKNFFVTLVTFLMSRNI